MLSSRELADLIAARPSAVRTGRIMSLAQSARREHQYRLADFLVRLGESFRSADLGRGPAYAHPGASADTLALSREDGPLAASELAWVQRLPADPTTVPFEDAQQLAGLVSAVSKMSQPADARLLESIWRPIREFHDKAAAQAELTAAQHPLPEVPSTAYGALADIIGQEADQLNDDERLARASAVLNAALATRTAAREQRIAAARDQVAAAETAAAERAAVTR